MKDDEVKAKGFEPLCLADFSGGETCAAKVPGCFEYNLYLIGKAPDPCFSDNIYEFRKYESYHQWYFTSFDSEFGHGVLRFDGIDTVADIIVNGKIVGKADNMFIPHEYEADGLKSTGNELVVHIYPSAVEARKRYVPAMASVARKLPDCVGALTYTVSIVLMLGVSLAVSFFVARKNRKIDMVEALKGAE